MLLKNYEKKYQELLGNRSLIPQPVFMGMLEIPSLM